MRELVRDYVFALNRAYLNQVRLLAPAEQAAMPLAAAGGGTSAEGGLTIAVAAARELHLIATTEPLPSPRGPEVELTDTCEELAWTVRFFDATILPQLGVLPAAPDGTDDAAAVRQVLGVADVIYHLSVSGGGGLTGHHAQHAGVALANQHAAAIRDADSLRRAYPARVSLVDEFAVCERLGLARAARLLAAEIGGPDLVDTLSGVALGDHAGLRRALLALARDRAAGR
ncbi:MAG: hypothetical protein WAW88_06145 [Nocardioides sp.]